MTGLTGDAALWGTFRSAMAEGRRDLALRAAYSLREPGAREAALTAWSRDWQGSPALSWYRLLWGTPGLKRRLGPEWDQARMFLLSDPLLPAKLHAYSPALLSASHVEGFRGAGAAQSLGRGRLLAFLHHNRAPNLGLYLLYGDRPEDHPAGKRTIRRGEDLCRWRWALCDPRSGSAAEEGWWLTVGPRGPARNQGLTLPAELTLAGVASGQINIQAFRTWLGPSTEEMTATINRLMAARSRL